MSYLQPARYDDLVGGGDEPGGGAAGLGPLRVRRATRATDLLATGFTVHACVDGERPHPAAARGLRRADEGRRGDRLGSEGGTMDRNLALEGVRITEAAALASARLMGRGDRHAADQAATEAMRGAFDDLDVERRGGDRGGGEGRGPDALRRGARRPGRRRRPGGRDRRRPARGHEALRHRRRQRHQRHRHGAEGLAAAGARHLHGEDRGRPGRPRRGGPDPAGRRQPARRGRRPRQVRRGPDRGDPRPAPARAAHPGGARGRAPASGSSATATSRRPSTPASPTPASTC